MDGAREVQKSIAGAVWKKRVGSCMTPCMHDTGKEGSSISYRDSSGVRMDGWVGTRT
jgi:hypothetical protein